MSSRPHASADGTVIDPPATLVTGDADATLDAGGLPSSSGERSAREQAGVSIARGVAVGRHLIVAEIGRGAHGRVYSAYDADLDRRVAIKVLLGPTSGEDRGVLLREAQALAKVHHPNVVAVFDVGTHEGLLYLAMEYFEGQTLRAWCHERTREPDEIMDAVVRAGQGLAAAHACGVVHGDFKPDNVLVGADNSVRVVDFGLARTVRATSPTTAARPTGTPGYMAPEVWSGREPDAKSDQFSFCAAMFEALYGERPFRRDTLVELGTAILEGRIDEPHAIRGPRRLLELLRRGLSVDPAQRHPSLAALLDQIAGARRRRWPMVARAASIGAAAVGVWLVARSGTVDDSGCAPGHSRIASVWNAERRRELRLSSPEVAGPFTRDAIDQTRTTLDDYAERWATAYDELCPAIRAARSDDSVALARSSCLEGRLDALAGLVEFVRARDVSPLDARALVETLPDVASCSAPDVESLAPVASDPLVATEIRDIDARVDEIEREMTNDLPADRATLTELLDRARASGHEHSVARVLMVRSRALFLAGEAQLAENDLEQALAIALGAGHDSVAMSVVLRRLAQDRLGVSGDPTPWFAIGRGLVERLGDPHALRADLQYSWAMSRMRRGQYADAVTALTTARSAYAALADSAHLTKVAIHLGRAYLMVGRTSDADAVLRAAEASVAGIASPPDGALLFTTLASVADRLGRDEHARAYEERALAQALDTFAPGSPGRSTALYNAALADLSTGRLEIGAQRLAASKASWAMRNDPVADAEFDFAEGMLALRRGWPRLALEHADRALASLANVPETAQGVYSNTSLRVRALWVLGRYRELLSDAETAHQLLGTGRVSTVDSRMLAHLGVGAALALGDRGAACVWLARLESRPPASETSRLIQDETYLWLMRRDDPRAMAAAMSLRARTLATTRLGADSVASIDRWLAGDHPVQGASRDRG